MVCADSISSIAIVPALAVASAYLYRTSPVHALPLLAGSATGLLLAGQQLQPQPLLILVIGALAAAPLLGKARFATTNNAEAAINGSATVGVTKLKGPSKLSDSMPPALVLDNCKMPRHARSSSSITLPTPSSPFPGLQTPADIDVPHHSMSFEGSPPPEADTETTSSSSTPYFPATPFSAVYTVHGIPTPPRPESTPSSSSFPTSLVNNDHLALEDEFLRLVLRSAARAPKSEERRYGSWPTDWPVFWEGAGLAPHGSW